MVAAVLDLHIGAVPPETVDQMPGGFAHRHDVIDLHPQRIADQVRRRHRGPGRGLHLFGIADDPADFGHGREGFGFRLRGASRDDQRGVWMLAAQAADFLPGLAHGLGGDGTGVDDDSVVQPGFCGQLLHRLGLIGVQAATKRGKNRRAHVQAARKSADSCPSKT